MPFPDLHLVPTPCGPFVPIGDLGDFSVTCRARGLLGEVKPRRTGRSHVRRAMLDHRHRGDVEIEGQSARLDRRMAAPGTAIARREGEDGVVPPG